MAFNPFAADLQSSSSNTGAFNPFSTNINTTRMQAPSAIPALPKLDQSNEPISPFDSNPLSKRMVDKLNFMGKVPEQVEAAQLGIVEGGVDVARNVYTLLRDLTDYAGLSDKKKTKEIREDFNSEREQYKNIPSVKAYPMTAGISKGLTEGVVTALPGAGLASKAGLVGSTVARGMAGGAVIGGGAGLISENEDPNNSIGDRLTNAGIGAAVGGAIGSVGPLARKMMSGSYTPQNAARQAALAKDAKTLGVNLPVPQIGGTPAAEGLQQSLSKVPVVGTAGSIRNLQGSVDEAQQAFMNSLRQPKDVVTQSYQKVIEAVNKNTQKNAFSANSIGREADIPLFNAVKIASETEESLAKLKLAPSGQVANWINNIKKQSRMPFEGAIAFRGELDDVINQVKKGVNVGATSKRELSRLSSMRSALESDIERAAVKAGAGEQYVAAKQMYKTETAYMKIKETFEKTSLTGVNPAQFGKMLKKETADIEGLLVPEKVAVLRGLNRIYDVAHKQLSNKLNPNPNATMVTGSVGAGSVMAASAMGAPGAAGLGIAAGLVKGVSYMLDSKLGRDFLTHIGRTSESSVKSGDLVKQLINGLISQQTANMVEQ